MYRPKGARSQATPELYTKKGKTGGFARLPLTDESVAANLRDVMPRAMQTVGNVKSLKHDGVQEIAIKPRKSKTIAENRARAKKLLAATQNKQLALTDMK